MNGTLAEATFKDAALGWFGELGCAVGHRPHLALGEPAARRDGFGEVALVGRSCGTVLQKLLNSELSVAARKSTIAAAS